MNLYSSLRTAVSGMNAQGVQLSSVAGNIANSGTTGYKRTSVEFETLLVHRDHSNSISGGVGANTRQLVEDQGLIKGTGSPTDLAISGDGFFLVRGSGDAVNLTRSGSFEFDRDGNLVNSNGYKLLGYQIAGQDPGEFNEFQAGALTPVKVDRSGLLANPTTRTKLDLNLPASAAIIGLGSRPSDNAAGSQFTARSSIIAYDNLGAAVTLDIFFTKADANRWEVTLFDREAGIAGGFPYSEAPLTTFEIEFDPADGSIKGESQFSFPKPDGVNLNVDLSGISQLAANFKIFRVESNGNGPASFSATEIDEKGTVYAIYNDGSRKAIFQIPSASVVSSANLDAIDGSAFRETAGSGPIIISTFGDAGVGRLISYALENSNVDLGTELTTMIEAQRSYAANSKAFKTSADMLDILMSLRP